MNILIIDDEPLVRRSLSRALQSRGHQCVEAQDGLEGLEKWQNREPDLVFLDVLMPGLNGPQVLEKKGPFKAKVILMSAYSGEHNLETALDLGASLFLAKPFEDIFEVVRLAEDLCK